MPTERLPLQRPKPKQEWQDAFYINQSDDETCVNRAWYKPMSLGSVGPFTSYDAAVVHGRESAHVWFQVERRYVRPGISIEYVDQPTPLREEWSDLSQFAEGMPGISPL